MNSILSISKNSLSCQEVAEYLAKSGIEANIISNISIEYKTNTKKYTTTQGCAINLCGLNIEKYPQLWDSLKNKFDLTCAHLKIDGIYSGCIYNYLKESSCPALTNSFVP